MTMTAERVDLIKKIEDLFRKIDATLSDIETKECELPNDTKIAKIAKRGEKKYFSGRS